MRWSTQGYGIAASSLLIALSAATAQAAQAEGEPEPEQTQQAEAPKLPFKLSPGPMEGRLRDIASIKVPEGLAFVEAADMAAFNRATGNLPNPSDIGALVSPGKSVIFFSWNDVGFVPDEDKDQLNPEDLLSSMKASEEDANKARRAQGMQPMYIQGWQTPPFYDPSTHNLTWAINSRVGEGDDMVVNHEVRLLGRRGAMSAILVAGPEELAEATTELNDLLEGFSFQLGQKYSEYTKGDKVAEYGLAGLVLGGGLLAATKTGLLAKLGKFIKLIVIGGIAVVGGAYSWLKKRFSGEV